MVKISKQKKDFNPDQLLSHLESFSVFLDQSIKIPHTKIKIGLDSIIGLIPGVGDSIGLLFSLYIVIQSLRFKLSFKAYLLMVLNILIDWLIGSIPIIGDIFDISWKTNIRNISLIKKYLKKSKF